MVHERNIESRFRHGIVFLDPVRAGNRSSLRLSNGRLKCLIIPYQ